MLATLGDLGLRSLQGFLALSMLVLLGYPLAWLAGSRPRDVERTGSACMGYGIATVALSWQAATWLGLPAWSILVPLAAFSLGLLPARLAGGIVRQLRSPAHPIRPLWQRSARLELWPLLAFAAILLVWRLYQVRHLAFPAWVDSVHHALIIRVMAHTWTVPRDLSPYLPMPFFYHHAYHALTTLLVAVARLPIPQAMIVMGQVLQVVATLSIYRLGRALWAEKCWAWVAAGLVAGGTAYPSFYTAWGKYPLLTAVGLMPLALSLVLGILRDGGNWRHSLGLGMLVAGTILAHTYSGLLLILLIIIALAQGVLDRAERHQPTSVTSRHQRSWVHVILGVGLGLLLAFPWIARLWQHAGRFAGIQVGGETLHPETAYASGYLAYLWALTGPAGNRVLLALALPGAFLAFRRHAMRAPTLWFMALLLLANPWGWRLRPFSPDQVLVVLWLPATLLATEALRYLWQTLTPEKAHVGPYRYGRLLGISAIILWLSSSFWQARDLVPEGNILATPADARAQAWVQDHVPPEARFFIAIAPWPPYGYRGADGGWWLLPSTGRQTLLPPAIWGLGDSRQVERSNALARRAMGIGGCSPEFWELVREERLDYIYLNTQSGPLRAQGFDGCEGTERVYAREGVYIYRLRWPPE